MFHHHRLKCYRMSLYVAKAVPTLTDRWPKGHGYLVDQLKRAASSVVLNIAEGNMKISQRERQMYFRISRASAAEVASIYDVAKALNLISTEKYADMQDRLLQIVKMLYKLK